MARVETLLRGIPLRTDRGSLAFCSQVLVTADSGRRILVDCGFVNDREPLLAALAARGLAPGDVDVLVLTHLHNDHCGNAPLFGRSEVVLSAAETAYVSRHGSTDLWVHDFHEAMLARLRVRTVNGDLDLEPDVRIVATPGHTDGHVSVLARTDRGTVGIAGDAAKSVSELIGSEAARGLPPSSPWQRSVARLLAEADMIVPGHDRAVEVHDGRVVHAGPAPALDLTLHFY